jgi:flagellar hook-associated protein 3 FlgL
MTVEVGRDGEDVFGASGSGIFDTLLNLKGCLLSDDVAGVQATLTALDAHLGGIRTAISDAGAKTLRLDSKEKILEEMNLTYTDRKSRIEDADIAEAIMDLKGKELAYQAALASSSKVMAMSLLDYL